MQARALAVAALLGASLAAQAQLFPDNEARKAIVELRERLAKSEEQNKSLAASDAQLLEQVQQLRRSLLELNNQLEALRGELARQRGGDEQLARDVAELQRRQKDMTQGVDERIRKLEPQKVALDGREFLADMDEKRQFDEALALLRGGDFAGSAAALTAFARRYPASGYTDAVRFWLGNAQYGKRELKEAIVTFRGFVAAAPDHPRVPEALLAVANSQVELRDVKAARVTLAELLKKYPQSEAAQAGKERLAALK